MTTTPVRAGDDLLTVTGVSKSFSGTQALAGVDLDVRRGEVHALVGGNGSGKSTLIKVLAGVYTPDAGSMRMSGRDVDLTSHTPERARELGLRFVHQDLGIFPALTVGENLALGEGFVLAPGHRIDWKRSRARAAQVLERFDVSVDPRRLASTLSMPQRAMLAIARALQDSDDDGVLVLDEPTAALPPSEVELLAQAIRRLTDSGRAVLLVTHRLDEVRHLADRVTGIRDGHRVGTIEAGRMTERDLVELIVGREVVDAAPSTRTVRDTAAVLELRGVTAGPLTGIDLDVRPGEILGVAGILGSGRSELLQTIFGALPLREGVVRVGGKIMTPTPRRMRAAGVAFVPEDRQAEAVFSGRTVKENITDGRLGPYFRGGWLRDRRLGAAVERDVQRFHVKTASSSTLIDNLSGGNQQKVILARWLRDDPRLLLLDEPTQGIDVGAREEIFEVVNEAANNGCAVVIVSSEFEELVRLCHRVAVLARGRIVAEHHAPLDSRALLESTLTAGANR